MLEEEFIVDNSDNSNENSESQNQVDEFPKTTKLLDRENLKDKKDVILTILKDNKLQTLFENNSEFRRKCVGDLLECQNDEATIKWIILKNLPDWYAYDISTGNVVEKQVNKANDNYTGATVTDKKWEQVQADAEYLDSEEVMRQAIEGRDRLVDKYGNQNLDAKTNVNSENYQVVKNQLEQNWTLNQLRQNHDEQFVNDYILVQATLVELKSNPTTYEEADISYFDKLVKNLNNACNIPDTNLSSFSSENITQTRTELFHSEVWNDSLIQAKNQNMESRDYSNIFPEMGDDEIIAKYGNFLKWGLKEFCQQYQNGPELKTRIENIKGNPSTDEERILLQNYQTMILELKNIKEQTENKTKNLMEELTIISQIKWMSMCIWQENWKDFNLNKAKEIQNDNWVLTLKGHIDWVDFSVRHDTTKENAHLQTSSKLWMTPDRNTFMVWAQGQYTDSPFIMPSQEEIFSVIAKEVQSDSNDLKNSDNVDSYLENLQQNIMWRMDKVYSEAKYAQHYIRDKVKWEKVMDSSLSLLRKIKPGIDIDLAKPINQANSGKLYDFIKMMNFNMENSTDTEKDKLCKCISKVVQIAYDYKNTRGLTGINTVNYPPIIENYLKNQTWLDDWNEDSKLWLVFDMLGYYNQNSKDTRTNVEWTEWVPSKVVINDLYRDLFEFASGESEVSAKRTNEKQEQKDREEADDTLHLDDPDIWPPV